MGTQRTAEIRIRVRPETLERWRRMIKYVKWRFDLDTNEEAVEKIIDIIMSSTTPIAMP